MTEPSRHAILSGLLTIRINCKRHLRPLKVPVQRLVRVLEIEDGNVNDVQDDEKQYTSTQSNLLSTPVMALDPEEEIDLTTPEPSHDIEQAEQDGPVLYETRTNGSFRTRM